MSGTSRPFRETAQRLVALEAGGRIRSAEQGSTVATGLHERLALHLSPLIGDAGFDALFARSLKKTKPVFSSLHRLDLTGEAHSVLGQLCEQLHKQEPAEVEEIVVALMTTFVSLLSTFIGEGLTWKLLHNAWPEVLPTEPPSGEI